MSVYKIMASGRLVDLEAFEPAKDFDWGDVAQGLTVPRYGNQTHQPYYVTEHSVILHDYFVARGDTEGARYALVHDAAEAYLGDTHSGVRHKCPVLDKWHLHITFEILAYLEVKRCPLVDEADRIYLNNELAFFWPGWDWGWPLRGISSPEPLSADEARGLFLDRAGRYWDV